MGHLSILNDLMEEKLLSLNTAFIAKVLSVSGNTAKIQPLNMVKQYGKKAEKQSVLSSVPILNNARYKLSAASIEYVSSVNFDTKSVSKKTLNTCKRESISKGDIVFCVCADRDITEARRGKEAVPSLGHHSQSDAVIVGIL